MMPSNNEIKNECYLFLANTYRIKLCNNIKKNNKTKQDVGAPTKHNKHYQQTNKCINN